MKYLIISLLLISTQLISAQSLNINFRKGPYLIYTGNTSEMRVLWQLNSSLQSTLKWGTDTTNYTNSVTTNENGSATDQHQHNYLISNLTPNQNYFYEVISGTDTIRSSFFSAQDENVSETVFYAYGDTRSYPGSQEQVSAALLSEINNSPNSQTFYLHAGDWTGDDAESSWDSEFFNRTYTSNIEVQAKLPIMGCRGNHEQGAIQYNKYWPYEYLNTGNYFSFDYGLAHISVLDLYVDFSTNSEQLVWLQNDLANSNSIWNFILLHEPAYTDTSAHKNNLDVQNFILPICSQHNVQLIIGGHNHYYAHCFLNHIHHLTLGGGGAPLYGVSHTGEGYVLSESSLHFSKITLNNTQAIIDIIRPDQSIIETINLEANTAIKNLNHTNPIRIKQIDKSIIIEQESFEPLIINVYNTLGQIILNNKSNNKKLLLNLSQLRKGVYIISVKSNTNKLVKKILIK